MSDIAKRIDAVVSAGLAATLKSEGFKKSGRTFRLTQGEALRVVSVQGSAYNAGAEGRFTLNLGVAFPGIRALLEPELPLKALSEAQCPFRQRIGPLMPQRRDHWWSVDERTELAALGEEVRQAYLQHGRAWLDATADLRSARDAFAANEHRLDQAAAASLLLGERDEALHLHARALRSEGWLQDYARTWGAKLGLT
jgi:hypothetical protein